MTWAITGNSSDAFIYVSKNGNIVIRGKAPHLPYIIEEGWVSADYPETAEALHRLQRVKADWRILSSDAIQIEVIDNVALLKAIEGRAGKSIAQISCIDRMGDSEPAISFTVVLQPKTFQQVYDLFSKLLVGFREIQYVISVEFLMFATQGVSSEIPTLNEFKSGRPYFSDVSVLVRQTHENGT